MATESEVKQEPVTEEQPVEREVEWNAENEVNLFYALRGHRPIEMMKKDIASQEIWDHLDEMYDMESLNQQDPMYLSPKEVDFDLPPEFAELKEKKKPRRKGPN